MRRPLIMSMLMYPINTSSHSCAQSRSITLSKTPYQATGALGGRYTTATNTYFACGIVTRVTCASTASDSRSGQRV